MADPRDEVALHDFEAVVCQPVYNVSRILDGQPGQCWIGCMLIDSHAVVEVLIWRVGNAELLLKDGSCVGNLPR